MVADPAQRDAMAAPSYLHANPLVRRLFWKRLDVVARLLAERGWRHGSGLDFGCGIGVQLPTLSAMTDRVWATDPVLAPGRVVAARLGLDNVTFIEPDRLSTLASLDYIVSADVLEHVEDLDGALRRFREVLRPGGTLLVSGPTETALYKLGRLLAGFGGKGDYHHTDIGRIHTAVCRKGGGFRVTARRALPLRHIIEAFHIYAYTRD